MTAVVVSSRQMISLVQQLGENLRAAHFVVIVRGTFVHFPDLLLIDVTQICFKAKIIGIYNTNSVEFGVCRQLARVNHSCIPSAELLTNTDLDTQDLRAVRTINKGYLRKP